MPLCEIVGFTCTMKTFNIAYAMITHENTDTYEWVLRCLRCLLGGVLPSVIVTDRELGLINALPRVFPTVNHQLCWVHVERKCGEMALELGKDLEYQRRFTADCWSLWSSRSVDSYDRRRRGMHARWAQLVPGLMAYLETTWLVPYALKILFVHGRTRRCTSALGRQTGAHILFLHRRLKRFLNMGYRSSICA